MMQNHGEEAELKQLQLFENNRLKKLKTIFNQKITCIKTKLNNTKLEIRAAKKQNKNIQNILNYLQSNSNLTHYKSSIEIREFIGSHPLPAELKSWLKVNHHPFRSESKEIMRRNIEQFVSLLQDQFISTESIEDYEYFLEKRLMALTTIQNDRLPAGSIGDWDIEAIISSIQRVAKKFPKILDLIETFRQSLLKDYQLILNAKKKSYSMENLGQEFNESYLLYKLFRKIHVFPELKQALEYFQNLEEIKRRCSEAKNPEDFEKIIDLSEKITNTRLKKQVLFDVQKLKLEQQDLFNKAKSFKFV
jgi:hypothetical protein